MQELNEDYIFGYESGYLMTVNEAMEVRDVKNLEPIEASRLLINVLGTERTLKSNNFQFRKTSRGLALKPKSGQNKNVIVITQDNSKKYLFKITTRDNQRNVIKYKPVSVDYIPAIINDLINSEDTNKSITFKRRT